MSSTASIPTTTTSHYELDKNKRNKLKNSNFSYFFPLVILFLIWVIKKKMKDAYLVFLFIFIFFTGGISYFYHDCQVYTNKDIAFSDDEKRGRECDNLSEQGIQFTHMYYMDLLFAIMSVYGVFLFLLPLTNYEKFVLFSFTLLWAAVGLSFKGKKDLRKLNFIISGIPTIVALIIFLFYPANDLYHRLKKKGEDYHNYRRFGGFNFELEDQKIRKEKSKYKYDSLYKNLFKNHPGFDFGLTTIFLGIGIGFLVAAGISFMDSDEEKYHDNHTNWHIFGAVSGGCFLLSSYSVFIK